MQTVKHLPTALYALGLSLLPGLAPAAPAGDATRGAEAAAVCVSCHQADGSGMNMEQGESWPRLAGLNADYLAKQLRDFQSGERVNPTMKTFANMLTEQQIVDVAQFYSEMTPTQGRGGEDADKAVLQRGQTLATAGHWSEYIVSCESCHGPDNQGAGSVFPGIAGQHAGYIMAQLKAWQEGTRTNDPQDLMGTIARRMSSEDIHAVAAWLATQPSGDSQEGATP
ncbi:cytochrome c4 [Hydrocarboniclastica marina]|uniref:Cytochrome c4 n=1 Tax=Hydrocarboniclastica marina TaxID=2259620 RepID=A0A4P7XM90_9ALTE|nr:cytochrome c4 [Hydrocarboniclastica marina]